MSVIRGPEAYGDDVRTFNAAPADLYRPGLAYRRWGSPLRIRCGVFDRNLGNSRMGETSSIGTAGPSSITSSGETKRAGPAVDICHTSPSSGKS